MNRLRPLIVLFVLLNFSCAKMHPQPPINMYDTKWKISEEYSYKYNEAESRKERLAVSSAGISIASECVNEEPGNPACYYYRAVNTGLYYQSKIIGYQKGIREMIADCRTIMSIDENYAYGGAHRILGQIYTELPNTSITRGGVTRDLELAEDYLNRAIEIAPDYPENYISIAKTYLEMDENDKAAASLKKARSLLPRWKKHRDYSYWKRDIMELSK